MAPFLFFFVKIGSFPVAATHSCHSLVPITHTFTLIFTVGHHTSCLDASLYTNCLWIHSDILFSPEPTQTRTATAPVFPSSSPPSIHPSPLYLHLLDAIIHPLFTLFLLCFHHCKTSWDHFGSCKLSLFLAKPAHTEHGHFICIWLYFKLASNCF